MADPPPLTTEAGAEWLTEADIARAAKLLISLCRGNAAHYALRRAGDLELTRSFEAEAIWRRIAKAIQQMQGR
jgi:hypothetical protein